MIIIRNLSSKGTIGFKYKDSICAKCAQDSGYKATGIFVILPSLDGFESDSPETKFQLITFLSQLRSSRKKMFFKIGVLKNFATAKHLRWSLFLKKLKKEESSTQVFSYEHYEIFKNSFLYRTITSGGCFCQFDKVALQYCAFADTNTIRNTIWGGFY